MRNYKLIDSDPKAKRFIQSLVSKKVTHLAIDFEGEYNLHQYGETLCLIQIYDGDIFYLWDPFKISTEYIKELLEYQRIVKLFYGAESDYQLVFKQYNIQMISVLDLQILVQALDSPKLGLDYVLQTYLNVEPSVNKKKYQKYNWTIRPINETAVEYALNDVAYLFELYRVLSDKLTSENKLSEVLEGFVSSRIKFNPSPQPGYKKKREYKNLSKNAQLRYDKIYRVRDRYAKELNWPPHNVLPNPEIFSLAIHRTFIGNYNFNNKIPRNMISGIKEDIEKID
ncbi:hypothetical protein [Spirochaeta cellobiosiphila]|uniref:hypothetical protein n=1 Tax=Spirochaeta cellobiosiphila TaxID=504483 RepID=UPI0003F6A0AF|nr:hypothetical protein [Spirochaeta cellobiosiphila]